jgi:serine/threonine-protein kinase RsbT
MPARDDVQLVAIASDDDVVTARQLARQLATDLGLGGTDITLLATAISEVARNITTYAGRGELSIEPVTDGLRRGVRIVASDEGPGIANLELALRDGYSSGSGLGLGLPGARRLVDEFDVHTEIGRGTIVTLVKWGRET